MHSLQSRFSASEVQHSHSDRITLRLLEGLSEPESYGDFVYKFKKILDRTDFLISLEKLQYVTKVLKWDALNSLHAY